MSFFSSDEQFQLMVASQDYTDVVCRAIDSYTGGTDQAIEEEFLIDVSDLIDENMPNLLDWFDKYPELRKQMTTVEGNIGGFPKFYQEPSDVNEGALIRLDWLEELGLESPKTYDDLHNVLTQFKEQKNASAPLVIPVNTGVQGNLLYGYNIDNYYQVDGQVRFGPMQPEFKEYLTMMNQWYSEGLIYHDFMSLDTSTYPQNLANGTFGMGVVDRGQFTATQLALEATDPNADLVGCKDARKNADEVLHIQYIDHHVADGYSITTCCENVEVAARYLDYLYTEEGSVLAGYGVEGEGLTYDGNGDPQLSDMILNNETYPCTPAMVLYATYGAPGIYDGSRYMAAYDERIRSAVELWGEDEQDWLYPYNAGLTIEESDTYSTIQSDIYTYVKEMTLKFITGASDPETEWDEYVAAIEGMGVDTIIQMKQDALDRYLAR